MSDNNNAPLQLLLNFDSETASYTITPKATPFLKWAGGKRKLLSVILAAAPANFDRYLEPFVGGGAVAFALGHQLMLLNDANTELMNTYSTVRDKLDILLPLLDKHQQAHSEEYFYAVREQIPTTLRQEEQAARFIYLNKACFNGLYRVNKDGTFNVPFGKNKKVILYDLENLRAASQVLQSAELFSEDYATFLEQHARPGDFIYLDPPYAPISQYSDFKRYTMKQFRENDQRTLAEVFNNLVKLGAYPVLSNSYSELTLDLYAQHHIEIVYANRNINHQGTGRKAIREILVTPRQ